MSYLSEKQYGFTLIEVLVAVTLLGIVSAAIAPGFIYYTKHNNRMEIKTGAIQAAQLTLDQLRLLRPSDMPSSGTDSPVAVTIGTNDYQVSTSYCVDPSFCPTNNTRHIVVSVTYNSEPIYELQTVFADLE